MRTYIAEALLARIRGGFQCKVHLLRSDCLLNKQYVKKNDLPYSNIYKRNHDTKFSA